MTWNGDYYAMGDGPDCEQIDSCDDYAGPVSMSDYEERVVYKYQFKDEESLITSEVFQKCLGQSLAHKDKTIRGLQQELLNILK